jgi:hypothetical protein
MQISSSHAINAALPSDTAAHAQAASTQRKDTDNDQDGTTATAASTARTSNAQRALDIVT